MVRDVRAASRRSRSEGENHKSKQGVNLINTNKNFITVYNNNIGCQLKKFNLQYCHYEFMTIMHIS